MADNEEEYDIHPLDRDYSTPTTPPTRSPFGSAPFHPKIRRVGLFWFLGGFVVVFLAAVALSNYQGGGLVETLASMAHKWGMVMILIGAIMIILAYRAPELNLHSVQPTQLFRYRYVRLLLANLVAFGLIVLTGYLTRLSESRESVFWVLITTITLGYPLMMTIAIWHRGLMRAYAIGILVAVPVNLLAQAILAGGTYWYSTSNLLATLLMIQAAGLACAGYVSLWGTWQNDDGQNDEGKNDDEQDGKRAASPGLSQPTHQQPLEAPSVQSGNQR
ncbi:MAG: hypothetical protein MI861_24700 [Pirellulales bacterium]|nr:hypothetical protein [Pirellulales bacterium]